MIVKQVNAQAAEKNAGGRPEKCRESGKGVEGNGICHIIVPPLANGRLIMQIIQKGINNVYQEHEKGSHKIGKKTEEPYFPDGTSGRFLTAGKLQAAHGDDEHGQINQKVGWQDDYPGNRKKPQKPQRKYDIVKRDLFCGKFRNRLKNR